MHTYQRLGSASSAPVADDGGNDGEGGRASPILRSTTLSFKTRFVKPLTLREGLIGITSFVLALLLFNSVDLSNYRYEDLHRQIIYRFKGVDVGPVKTLLVFGDSYSDNCNLWRLASSEKEQHKYPWPSCPPPPIGRSNGAQTWPELMATRTGVEVLNFAHSASTCSNDIIPVVYHDSIADDNLLLPSTKDQIEMFANANQTFVPKNTVAVIFGGTNDIAAILAVVRADDKKDAHRTLATIPDEAQCIMDRVQQLYDLGVRRLVVMSNVPLQRTPLFSHDTIGDGTMQNGQAISGLVDMMVHDNIAAQAALLPTVQGRLYDADVQIFDTYSLFSELLDDPVPTFGAKYNVESWCHYCLTGECHLCPQPDEYMFMDDLHPTQKVHEVMAARLSDFIGLPYAPEP